MKEVTNSYYNENTPSQYGDGVFFYFLLVTPHRVVPQTPETAPGRKPNRWLSKIVVRFYPLIQLSDLKHHKKTKYPHTSEGIVDFFW